MRIHRISLRHFRGIDELDVTLEPAGVTIVEGRNEIGKTSLTDAFMLLLDVKDSSSAKPVKDVKPIGRDVGPFVEAELTIAEYHLTYRKQWMRGKMTELEITRPSHEQLSGEAAHNRVMEILAEKTDPQLFRALRYLQGVDIAQAAVGGSSSLVAALDAAAGGVVPGPGADGDALFSRVEQEKRKYFTAGGKVTSAREQRKARIGVLESEVEDVRERIRGLEDTASRFQQIERELVDLRARLPGARAQVEESTRAVRAVEELERRAERARLVCEAARSTHRETAAAMEARASLVLEASTARKVVVNLEHELSAAAAQLEAAQGALASERESLDKAKAAREGAEMTARSARQAVERLELRIERDLLSERHSRVSDADSVMHEADEYLAASLVTDALLQQIDKAVERLALARGRADAGSAHVVVEALGDVDLSIDGDVRHVAAGDSIRQVISADTAITFPNVARVVVSPPALAEDWAGDLEQAEQELAAGLEQAGLSSPTEARPAALERSRWETERESARQRRADALRDLDASELAGRLARAEERLRALGEVSGAPAADSETLEVARVSADEAELLLRQAREHEEERQSKLRAAEASLHALSDKSIVQRTRLEVAAQDAERLEQELATQRSAADDAALQVAATEADDGLKAALAEQERAEEELTVGDPTSARAVLENSQELSERLARDIQQLEIESATARAALDAAGHEGLADRLASGLEQLEELRREVSTEDRRAAAADLLHRLLKEKREQAQLAYVEPLRAKVNAYARILFGPTVEVEINPATLEVASRTLGGTTVPFAALSGGAREQLAVLARLACAALVSPAGAAGIPRGVPVIIDDALGYTDPERLEKIGAAFSVAGKDCQVIVLTCEPGRYRGVGGAHVVSVG
jgi:hypothetical protein